MARLVDRYVLREVTPTFLVGLLLVAFVLLMDQVLLVADLFIDKGVPVLRALRLLALLLPSVLVFALPMAVLMGILGGLARLSADSEIVAFASVGIGPRRLARPLAVFGLAGFLATLPLALYWAPRANDAWVRDMTASVLGRVRLKVEPLEFNETLPGLVFLVREVGPDGVWAGVFAAVTRDAAPPRILLARSGRIRLLPEERRAVLELRDGTSFAGPAGSPGEDTVTSFDRLEEEIDVAGIVPSLAVAKRVREKDIGELVRDLRALETGPPSGRPQPRQVRAHRIEIHKKFALPAACLVFALIGLPLGVMTGRSGRTGGFSLSLVLILLYYVLLTAGEQAAIDGRLPAFWGMWGPNLILTAAAAWLLLRRRRRTAGPRGRAARPEAAASPAAGPGRAQARSVPAAGRPFAASPRFPGLLDRYVSRRFLTVLAFALAALAAAAYLFAFFETWSEVMPAGKPAGLAARYALAALPENLAYILPASVLAAALLALGLLVRTGEATAFKAGGVSVYRTVLPVLLLAAAAGFLSFLVRERIVPAAHARAEMIRNELYDRPARSVSYANRHWVLGARAERIYHFDYFEPGAAAFARLSVFDLDPRRWTLLRRTYADKAAFDGDGLVYHDGWTRDYAASAGPAFARSAAGRLDAAGDRTLFRAPWREPLRMTFGDLRRYAAEVRSLGFPAVRLRAALAEKAALPFVSLVMALLAVPFGFGLGRKGALAGIGASVVIAMAYWGAFALCRSLGAAGILGPFLGAWGANLLFGLAGVVGLLRLRT
ncbi:MAG TPA: LptF/LptG family permease [Candidatus Aminicenantes bacterium]|nr:LptF/LptG family permease [Candidatus Aminicenantes bacterium]HRY63790.1 LptF/LptG family permease [Candidatus Aminicenantes bacterium]HRZ70703.1 LptF/LptG family permease [Candidatus Aminicenantes bacterium]